MLYIVYRNTYDRNGKIIKDFIEGIFGYESQAVKWADECERITRNKDIWFTVEEEQE
jgi:hypothetical protein